jgi:hypothetical protein
MLSLYKLVKHDWAMLLLVPVNQLLVSKEMEKRTTAKWHVGGALINK